MNLRFSAAAQDIRSVQNEADNVSPRRLAAAFAAVAVLIFFTWPVSREKLTGNAPLRILSSEGYELIRKRSFSTGAHSQSISLSGYPDILKDLVIQAEDRWFRYHPGFNPLSVIRAAYQNLKHGRTVSGASGITQQTVRIVWKNELPRNPWLRKPAELLLSLKLELQYSKDEILEAYMNRVPLRFNTEGFASASRRIFSRDVSFLSVTEAAALTVLARGSYPGKKLFHKRLQHLLEGRSTSPEEMSAVTEMVFREIPAGASGDLRGNSEANAAPHFTDWLSQNFPGVSGTVHSEISYNLNKTITDIINAELTVIENKNATNAAAVVLELKDGALYLRALAGSRSFTDDGEGQVNGAFALRNAGSTLKPFIYALAMDQIGLRPWSLLNDENRTFRTGGEGEIYRPLNYDLNYWGLMTAREALAASRNIPPVILLEKTGSGAFYGMLKNLDFRHMESGPEHYGPGVVLGSSGVTLLDLTKAYSIFPAKGYLLPVRTGKSENFKFKNLDYGSKKRIIPEHTAIMITGILSDSAVRKKAFGKRSFLDFPFPVAAKTGTSKDYRDSWTVGYTDRFIVGVWAGNFSGESMNGISGAYGAGRIFHQIMRLLHPAWFGRQYRPAADSVFYYPASWKKAEFCREKGCVAVSEKCTRVTEYIPPSDSEPPLCSVVPAGISGNLTIEKPAAGERFLINPHIPLSSQAVPVRISAPGHIRYKVIINGKLQGEFQGRSRISFPAVPGNYNLAVVTEDGITRNIRFTVIR